MGVEKTCSGILFGEHCLLSFCVSARFTYTRSATPVIFLCIEISLTCTHFLYSGLAGTCTTSLRGTCWARRRRSWSCYSSSSGIQTKPLLSDYLPKVFSVSRPSFSFSVYRILRESTFRSYSHKCPPPPQLPLVLFSPRTQPRNAP
jgi:hypothetical protein